MASRAQRTGVDRERVIARNRREGNMAVRDALEGYDEKTKTQVEAMIDAERRALARRGREPEDCSCKTGMFPHLGRRSVLVAAGSALAASLAPLPTPARAAERKAPSGENRRTIRPRCLALRPPKTADTARARNLRPRCAGATQPRRRSPRGR